MMRLRTLYALFLLYCVTITAQHDARITTELLNEQTAQVEITIPVTESDYLYHDDISLSVDHPYVTLSDWQTDQHTSMRYEATTKERKKVYTHPLKLSLTAQRTDNQSFTDDIHLHLTYRKKFTPQLHTTSAPLGLLSTTEQKPTHIAQQIETDTVENIRSKAQPVAAHCKPRKRGFSDYISNLLKTTESMWARIILALVLGILMSLTPCIYPMIPITAGILQSQGTASLARNFLLSLCYSVGMALTFALLGLGAAFTGQIMGSIMINPYFIISLSLLLVYLGLSMLGLYDMYIPRFLQPKGSQQKGGSMITAFMFGIASGTVASPCLSPGLVLLLSVVTALGNPFLGFILLFTFGIGLSLPLLIIGSFSSSLSMLPRAGMWMIEVKKIFGLLLLAMSLYFLNNVLPTYIVTWLAALGCTAAGIFYLRTTISDRSGIGDYIRNIVGCILLAVAVFIGFKAYQATVTPSCPQVESIWQTQYACARTAAVEQGKKLFLDIGAPYCSLCKAIDRKIFTDKRVITALAQVVPAKLDGSDDTNNQCSMLQQKFGVRGFPTILLVDPKSEKIIRKWGGEVYDMSPQEFIDELETNL